MTNKINNIALAVLILLFSVVCELSASTKYSFRKYQHVKKFYKDIYKDAIELGLKYNVPPASIMAIAGLESGYGRGYVAQITGNIMSLGAYESDYELPALYLPYSKSKKTVLFDPKEIKELSKSDLVYKRRPKSLKRDYRPAKYAGSEKKLELLKYDDELREKAYRACIEDFATRWISPTSNIKAFKEAKIYLDKQVKLHGKDILFTKELNEKFIGMIGGRPNSFNYRESWPKKAKLIMKKVGLVELVKDIHLNNKSFEDAWRAK
jgi:hypothetical protein